jgi:2-methylisocitrate lyase-like PEP mutase family enzyme
VNDAEDIQRLVPPGFVAEGVGDDVGWAGRGLVSIAEFQGKIEAVREARGEGDLVVIARTEAFTVGLGADEAIPRAEAYTEARADMIFVHSKAKTPEEIEAFVDRWDGRVPFAVAPTAYPWFTEARAARTTQVGIRAAVKRVYQGLGSLRSRAAAITLGVAVRRARGRRRTVHCWPLSGVSMSVTEAVTAPRASTPPCVRKGASSAAAGSSG